MSSSKRVTEDTAPDIPFRNRVNCVNEDKWGGDIYLPKYENKVYDETADTPSMAYLVGYTNTINLPICLDTGAGRSLMNFETWRKINANDQLELKPQHRGFEAVNGSRISCRGSAIIRLMLMGESKNYEGFFKFFVVESLSVDALLGLDEIYRHDIRINMAEGFAWQDKVGKLKSNLVFKCAFDIGVVRTEQHVNLDPGEIKPCKITKTISLNQDVAIMEPLIVSNDVRFPKTLINDATDCTVIANTSNKSVKIQKGTHIANLYPGGTETVGVLAREKNEDEEDNELEMGISIEPDELVDSCEFGLQDSDLTEQEIKNAKSLIKEYRDLFQWGDGPLTCAHKYEHEIRLIPGAKPVY